MKTFLFSVLCGFTIQLSAQAVNCKAVANFTTNACNQITQDMCLASGNPATCTVAGILAWDDSEWGNKYFEKGMAEGCTYTVTKTSQGYQVVVEGSKSAVDNFLSEFKKHVLSDNWQYYSGY